MASMFDTEIKGIRRAIGTANKIGDAIDPSDGLRTTMRLAAGQLHRYTIGQPRSIMRVDTGRLKNSIFPDVRKAGRQVVGIVGTNVEYAPFVEARYGFFDKAVKNQERAINSLFERSISKHL